MILDVANVTVERTRPRFRFKNMTGYNYVWLSQSISMHVATVAAGQSTSIAVVRENGKNSRKVNYELIQVYIQPRGKLHFRRNMATSSCINRISAP